MPLFLLNFLKGFRLKHLMYTVGAALFAFFIYTAAVFVDDKYEAEAEVLRLELQVAGYKEAIDILNAAAEQKDDALATANAVIDRLNVADETYDEIRRSIAGSKEEDDGPVAPVLRRTLNSLGRM